MPASLHPSMAAPAREPFLTPRRAWEAAYRRFESPTAELRKFSRRLSRAGASAWSTSSRILELFSGRGGGVEALRGLGFRHVTAIDLSPTLLATSARPAILADCRALPCASRTQDVVVIQGGLHHLPQFPGDLELTLQESSRVLSPEGRIVIVEPWMTPFLRFVHLLCSLPPARRLSAKIDALATMIEHERSTYEQWLSNHVFIESLLIKWFLPERWRVGFGKLLFVGRPRRAT